MARRNTPPNMTDPQWVNVQIQIRLPFWRRAQLIEAADERGLSVAELVTAAVDKAHPPKIPQMS